MANYQNQVSSILYHEGGLSKNKTDSASKNPVPDGSGYHTNKGITWATFTSLAAKLNYTPTPALFYQMPENIWLKIYKICYWNPIQGDAINSQPIADLLVQIAFGSGPSVAGKSVQRVLNSRGYTLAVDGIVGSKTLAAINTETETAHQAFYTALYNYRLSWLKKLSTWSVFGNGWTNRYTAIAQAAQKYFTQTTTTVKKNLDKRPLPTVVLLVGLALILAFTAYQVIKRIKINV